MHGKSLKSHHIPDELSHFAATEIGLGQWVGFLMYHFQIRQILIKWTENETNKETQVVGQSLTGNLL